MDESRRCTATSSRSGERCRKAAILGGTVCGTHGGRAPQVRSAANIRHAHAKAMGLAGAVVEVMPMHADPATVVAGELSRSLRILEVLAVNEELTTVELRRALLEERKHLVHVAEIAAKIGPSGRVEVVDEMARRDEARSRASLVIRDALERMSEADGDVADRPLGVPCVLCGRS